MFYYMKIVYMTPIHVKNNECSLDGLLVTFMTINSNVMFVLSTFKKNE
jgi:hypothetical protein